MSHSGTDCIQWNVATEAKVEAHSGTRADSGSVRIVHDVCDLSPIRLSLLSVLGGGSQVAVPVLVAGGGLVVVALLAVGDVPALPVLAVGVGRQLRVGAARSPDERVRARAQLHELLLDALRDGAPRLLLRRVRAL